MMLHPPPAPALFSQKFLIGSDWWKCRGKISKNIFGPDRTLINPKCQMLYLMSINLGFVTTHVNITEMVILDIVVAFDVPDIVVLYFIIAEIVITDFDISDIVFTIPLSSHISSLSSQMLSSQIMLLLM